MTDVVAAQYEQWIYPAPIMDLEAYCKTQTDAVAPHLVHLLYWPDGYYERQNGKINILVAGCGANAAARYAYQHPNANVVGIDLSGASLTHERYLKQKHGLNNLTLHQMRIEDIHQLELAFDFIDSVGVLHHLPDPVEGLTQLKAVLKPHGVMGLMLYGFYGRFEIYLLQNLFQKLYIEQTPDDVAVVRQILSQLPPEQQQRIAFAGLDLSYDAGIVDLLLHPIDRAYTVESTLEYVNTCDLVFQGWLDNCFYYPEGSIQPDTTLWNLMNILPEPERWKAMELFNGRINKHAFYVCKQERPKASYQIDLDSEQFLDYIPCKRISKINQPDYANGVLATIERPPAPAMSLTELEACLFNEMDGKNTIRACIQNLELPGNEAQSVDFARAFFKALWRRGYVMFKLLAGA